MPDHRPSPFDGVTDYFSELGRMRALGTHGAPHPSERGGEVAERTHASAWVPVTDILAVGDDLVVQVELPGVEADQVDLRFDHGVLTVCGARPASTGGGAAEGAEYYVRERFVGEFRRSITLPDATTAGDISAEFGEGLVEITVRGAARSSSTRIAVADRSRGTTSRPVASD